MYVKEPIVKTYRLLQKLILGHYNPPVALQLGQQQTRRAVEGGFKPLPLLQSSSTALETSPSMEI